MNTDSFIQLTSQALILCLTVSLPVVLVSAAVGLLVSFVLAITSLQEQSISQGAKLIAVVVTLLLAAPWGAATVLNFATQVMQLALQ
ncbi:type III secretion system export apparatus subunit SctS [Paucibacter sp. PLA-PC-4]|uniref:type III secretion system export apparatus subunit SctS n=1 Tax=Paucibacter sp. PLA-PC-4 TaxID=2993655 RepID=UPI00224B170A|nr:type III secretion system export apparatus subunit SctS [Paucibacter sp. PLA-PC-4]MCX2865577.1 type III secretion system export apparatus subunit SctS [Paucibacter sp. PLA-PC-4]